MTNIPMLTL